jgi:hypothetical protein
MLLLSTPLVLKDRSRMVLLVVVLAKAESDG